MPDKRKQGNQNISIEEFTKRLANNGYSAAARARTTITKAAWSDETKKEAHALVDHQFGKKTVDTKVRELVETAQKLEKNGELKVHPAPPSPLLQPPPPVQPPPFITGAMLMDLDIRELAVIDRMRARALPPPPFVPLAPKHLNGANTRS